MKIKNPIFRKKLVKELFDNVVVENLLQSFLGLIKEYENEASRKTKDEFEKEIEEVSDAVKILEKDLKKERKMLAAKEKNHKKKTTNC